MHNDIVNFLFEVGILNEQPRTGFHFLGGGQQSVAEHSFRMAIIAYCLAHLDPAADQARLIKMCLLHDVVEARTGDLNYVHRKYVQANEAEAIAVQAANLPFGEEYEQLMEEFRHGQSREACLARDADQLELLLTLKRIKDLGHPVVQEWIDYALKRLKTQVGQELGRQICTTRYDAWWFTADEQWWVEGKK